MAMVNVVESHAVGDVTLTRGLLKIHQAGYGRKLLRCFCTKENCSFDVSSTTACLLKLRFTQDMRLILSGIVLVLVVCLSG